MEATASNRLDAAYMGASGGVSVETALLDQRMRAEKHRTNFESLKAQHLRLQEVSHGTSIAFTHSFSRGRRFTRSYYAIEMR